MNVTFKVGSTVASYRRGKDRFFDVQEEQGLVTRYVFPDPAHNAPGAGTAPVQVSLFRAHEEYPAEIIDILRLPHLHVGDKGMYTGIHCPGLSESDPPGDAARVSLHLSSRRPSPDEQPINASVTLTDCYDPWYQRGWRTDLIDFCPVSGRLCAANFDGNRLSVFDYITPYPGRG